ETVLEQAMIFQGGHVPAPIATLIANLPARGSLASSPLTAGRAAGGLLSAWGAANAPAVAGAVGAAAVGVNLIRIHKLMGWDVPDAGEMLHDGFLQEFGWEFLIG